MNRRAWLAAAAGSAICPAARAEDVLPDQRVRVRGDNRRYRLVRPDTLVANPPLVLAFHGVGDSPANMARYSGLDDAARAHGWLLAYPRAMGGRWPYFSLDASQREVDYVSALIDDLAARYGVDENRVHLTGMSGGGYFINFVGSRLSERIASIAAHSGGAGGLGTSGIHATHKYPVLIIHGDADESVPVEMGRALAALYRGEGHEVEYWEIPGLRHRWATRLGVNARIAAFFATHPRSA